MGLTIAGYASPEDEYFSQVEHLVGTNYFQVASFTILIYEYFLTFPEEVERIWKRPMTGASILFLVNRYITPLQFIVSIVAHNDPSWSKGVCERFAPFQGVTTIVMVAVCELIMILRVFALYKRNLLVLTGLLLLLTAQVAVSLVGISTGHAITFPPGIVGCIFSGTSKLFPALWVAPLVTDTVIFLLTIYRARGYITLSPDFKTLRVFVRDGAIYFFVIFLANLLNVLVYFLSPAHDLRSLGASFSQIMGSVVISRLVLNLRSGMDEDRQKLTRRHLRSPSLGVRFVNRAIGDLAGEIVDSEEKKLEIPRIVVTTSTEVSLSDIERGFGLDEFVTTEFSEDSEDRGDHGQ